MVRLSGRSPERRPPSSAASAAPWLRIGFGATLVLVAASGCSALLGSFDKVDDDASLGADGGSDVGVGDANGSDTDTSTSEMGGTDVVIDGTATDSGSADADSAVCATLCDTRCVDLTRDPNNCGACGARCDDTTYCNGSKCVCRPGFTLCGSTCTDLKADANNCGGCGTHCSGIDDACNGGTCDANCNSPRIRCSPTDPWCGAQQTDPTHCGGCGVHCDADELCVSGLCQRYGPAFGCVTCPCASCDALDGGTASCCSATSYWSTPLCIVGSCPPP